MISCYGYNGVMGVNNEGENWRVTNSIVYFVQRNRDSMGKVFLE